MTDRERAIKYRKEARRYKRKYFELKQATEQTGHWVPVNERLPEENGYYLTTTMYHEVYCDYWEEERFNRTEAVIAWMPLPTPYEPQERSDDGETI